MIPAEAEGTTSPVPSQRRPWLRALLWGCAVGVLLAVGANVFHVGIGRNFHTVIPGVLHRCAQPSEAQLERLIQQQGIRTVVNLRGSCPFFPWYLDECRVTHRRNVSQEDVYLSASRLPSVHEARRLAEIFTRSEPPMVMHCRRGADRTGLAALIAVLLLSDSTTSEARRQLSPRFGHLAVGRTANLDRFLGFYEEWLGQQEKAHSPPVFHHWLTREYCPGECRAELALLKMKPVVAAGEPFAVEVRAHNTSIRPWRFRRGNDVGVHAAYQLFDMQLQPCGLWKAGLFDAEVAAGDAIDLTLALPALRPGRYLLRVDLVDEQHCSFFQAGSELLEQEFDVREQETAAGGRAGFAGLAGLADRLASGR